MPSKKSNDTLPPSKRMRIGVHPHDLPYRQDLDRDLEWLEDLLKTEPVFQGYWLEDQRKIIDTSLTNLATHNAPIWETVQNHRHKSRQPEYRVLAHWIAVMQQEGRQREALNQSMGLMNFETPKKPSPNKRGKKAASKAASPKKESKAKPRAYNPFKPGSAEHQAQIQVQLAKRVKEQYMAASPTIVP